MFATCVDALASKGKLIIIGMMSQYCSGWAPSSYPGLTGGPQWHCHTALLLYNILTLFT